MTYWLLETKTRRLVDRQLYADKRNAIASGILFCGEHNPIDGCSTPPTIRDKISAHSGSHWSCQRNTSFGERTAEVFEISSIID